SDPEQGSGLMLERTPPVHPAGFIMRPEICAFSVPPSGLSEVHLLRFGQHARGSAYRTANDHARRATNDTDSRADSGAGKPAVSGRRTTTGQQKTCQNHWDNNFHGPFSLNNHFHVPPDGGESV